MAERGDHSLYLPTLVCSSYIRPVGGDEERVKRQYGEKWGEKEVPTFIPKRGWGCGGKKGPHLRGKLRRGQNMTVWVSQGRRGEVDLKLPHWGMFILMFKERSCPL